MSNKDTIFNSKVTIVSIIVTIAGIFTTVFYANSSGPAISIRDSAGSILTSDNGSSVVTVMSNNTIHTVSTSSSSNGVFAKMIDNSESSSILDEHYSDEDEKLRDLDDNSLLIGGAGNSIEIRRGDKNTIFKGAAIMGSGLDQIIYVERGRNINVYIKGAGHNLLVDQKLMPALTVSDSGVGTNISEF